VVGQYTRQATHYAASSTHSDARALSSLVEFAALTKGADVLDVATGTGFTAFAFADAGCRVTGLDITAAMLSQARQIAHDRGISGLMWVKGRSESLPFASGSFQGVTCRLSAHHFSDVPAFLKEARRILKKQGTLIIADTSSPDDGPNIREWFNRTESLRDPSHNRNYSPGQWQDMMRDAALEVTGVDYSRRVKLNFSRWVAMAGTPKDKVEELRSIFIDASAEIKLFFAIEDLRGDISFRWPVVHVKAVKS